MADYTYKRLKPTLKDASDNKSRVRLVTTRARATQMLEIMKKEFPRMTEHLRERIDYELKNSEHDKYVAFYIYDDNVDEATALQLTCMQMCFTYIDWGTNDND